MCYCGVFHLRRVCSEGDTEPWHVHYMSQFSLYFSVQDNYSVRVHCWCNQHFTRRGDTFTIPFYHYIIQHFNLLTTNANNYTHIPLKSRYNKNRLDHLLLILKAYVYGIFHLEGATLLSLDHLKLLGNLGVTLYDFIKYSIIYYCRFLASPKFYVLVKLNVVYVCKYVM